VTDVLGSDRYRVAAHRLQRAYARRDGVTEIGSLIDEVIGETTREPQHV
jgi:hypothetical protein